MDNSKPDLSFLTTTLECLDNSCLFRDKTKKKGIGTNGGCRCFSDLDQKRRIFVNRMFHELRKIQEADDA